MSLSECTLTLSTFPPSLPSSLLSSLHAHIQSWHVCVCACVHENDTQDGTKALITGPSEAREGWSGHRSDNNRAVATNLQVVRLIQFHESWRAKRAEVRGSGSIHLCLPKLLLRRSWVVLQDTFAFHSFTSIKRSEQLSKRRDFAAKNAAATTVSTSKNDASVHLKCVNAHATRVGKTKVVLMKTDQLYWWLRP